MWYNDAYSQCSLIPGIFIEAPAESFWVDKYFVDSSVENTECFARAVAIWQGKRNSVESTSI
ncbi:hypothetical protein RchiOBHm_Chr7g0216891 [Rosa chinensis]|uniref:Uncharacterized protein n=1 Tax=Rosa chinensis TaxID=74649 RepID=A0A2P6PBV3_ROSCH|nr:hypothetical protein RchiOBHm_Chr7g0216891 [Rosa chinensis]